MPYLFDEATRAERERLASRVISLDQKVAERERQNIELYKTGKEILTRGRRAALFSDYLAFAPPERERLEFEIQAFYQDFVEKVARCRSLSAEAVEPSAQGRVWSGRQAWVRGLVDEMGGLEEALAEAKRRMGLPAERPVIVERIPKAPSSWRLSLLLRLLPRTSEVPWWWAPERVWAILPFSLRLL